MGNNNRGGKLFVISGPSGVGKTTLAQSLLDRFGKKYNIARVITYTTKEPRVGEQDGIDYHFVTIKEFESKIAAGFFIEHSQAYGNYYGSPKYIVSQLKEGKSFILVTDQTGACNIKQQYLQAVLIWITPPSIDELTTRLQKRAADNSADIEKRLLLALDELSNEQNKQQFDYIIENNVLLETIEHLSLILKAEISSGSTKC